MAQFLSGKEVADVVLADVKKRVCEKARGNP
jgi:hypothetical protein